MLIKITKEAGRNQRIIRKDIVNFSKAMDILMSNVLKGLVIRTGGRVQKSVKKKGKKPFKSKSHAHAAVLEQLPDNPFDEQITDPKECGEQKELMTNMFNDMFRLFQEKWNSVQGSTNSGSMNFVGTLTSSHALICLGSKSMVSTEWIIDTGASDHMTSLSHLFCKSKPLKQPVLVTLPDGTTKTVTTVGQIKLTPSITLYHVLLIPDFKYNLLSVSKLLHTQRLSAHFTLNIWKFQVPSTNETVVKGEGLHGLYKFHVSSPNPSECCTPVTLLHTTSSHTCNTSAVSKQDKLLFIHSRLGHISLSKLQHMDSYKHLNFDNFLCHTCQYSKFHRIPFPDSNSHTNKPFELIHVDLWGPYRMVNIDGSSYFLTIIDDHTKCTWTYLLSSKSQVPTTLINFFHYIHTQFQTMPQTIRSDNGPEFVNRTCSSFFTTHGIIH